MLFTVNIKLCVLILLKNYNLVMIKILLNLLISTKYKD